MKNKILTLLFLLVSNLGYGLGNWVVTNATLSPNLYIIPSTNLVDVGATYKWVSATPYDNFNHWATLTIAIPNCLNLSSGTPLATINNVPISTATYTLANGGWLCDFTPTTILPNNVEIRFNCTGFTIKNDQNYILQSVTSWISFIASPQGENYSDNVVSLMFATEAIETWPLPIKVKDSTAAIVYTGNNDKILIYPNPTGSTLHIKYTSEKKAVIEVRVFMADGRLAKYIVIKKGGGDSHIMMNTDDLSEGAFTLVILKNNKEVAREKIIIHHN
jgi:hypothetical protein